MDLGSPSCPVLLVLQMDLVDQARLELPCFLYTLQDLTIQKSLALQKVP